MSTIGQLERKTQARVVKLFRDTLGYEYLGNWHRRSGNANIEPELLRAWLERQGVDSSLITRAIHELERTANNASQRLYDRNRAVYELLRYGVKIKPEVGENTRTVWLIDWQHPENNHFAIAEEVTIAAADPRAHDKRPDVVLYVNGIALGVLELKRSTVSMAEGIRQNIDSQKKLFIEHFFSTIQYVMAGNDTQGLRYGTIETPEKYYLTWKEGEPGHDPLYKALTQVCAKERFLEIIHDFAVFDHGTKKLCRPHQYFGVREAQSFIKRREGGIIWHMQGSGKSLVMVWMTKWIRENVKDARVLIITDRIELDEQIEGVFKGVNEDIYRTRSGADLVTTLNATAPWLICSLIHKFRGKEDGEPVGDIASYLDEVKKSLPRDFEPKGDVYVFVDECHRTQSGDLHDAMKAILPNAVFIGFTGTPLLRTDKRRTMEVFGRYIHTYRFDEAVKDGVVLDLRYEARDIDQVITSPAKIDQWFEAKTRGLSDLDKAQLKKRWGTLQKVHSSEPRLRQIADDILTDMALRDRLMSGRGNAMIVSGSIYQACRLHEIFAKSDLKGKCAIITSYKPTPAAVKGEDSGEGLTERLAKYEIYKQMLADWFNEPPETAVNKVDIFERQVKQKFVKEPGQMKLLIVVDKLLTGFDAPPATYLYIDKAMRDHGLFQAICRVNRLDSDDKEYGYIIDYRDLFKNLRAAVADYTSGAFDGYDKEDVAGLLSNRVEKARERLEDAQEAVRALCEPVEAPKDDHAYYRYFSSEEHGNAEQLKANEPRRLALYTKVAALVRAYANLANDMAEAGYSEAEAETIKKEVAYYENLRKQIKLHSGDVLDLKLYEPAMRHLLDMYIRAEDTEKISAFDDMSLIQLIIERGVEVVQSLPDGLREDQEAVAETIENNVRRLIIDEHPINPKYYDKMSELLDALIKQRREKALDYKKYLETVVELTRKVKYGPSGHAYPELLDTPAKRALYDNLDRNETRALAVDEAVRASRQDDWRNNSFKIKRVKLAIKAVLDDDEEQAEQVLELVKNQNEY